MQLKLHKQACWESHALVAVTVQLMCVSWSHYLQKTPVYLRQKIPLEDQTQGDAH